MIIWKRVEDKVGWKDMLVYHNMLNDYLEASRGQSKLKGHVGLLERLLQLKALKTSENWCSQVTGNNVEAIKCSIWVLNSRHRVLYIYLFLIFFMQYVEWEIKLVIFRSTIQAL